MKRHLYDDLRRHCDEATLFGTGASHHAARLTAAFSRHLTTITETHGRRLRAAMEAFNRVGRGVADGGCELRPDALREYLVDAWQRGVLTFDALRERGNIFNAHEFGRSAPGARL